MPLDRRTIRYRALLIAGGLTSAVLVGVFFVPIPEYNQTLAAAIGGAIVGSFGTIVSFYFGSSEDVGG